MLKLERPLAVVDAESTGLDPKTARIVRLTVLKVWPDGKQELKTALINPGEPISPGATAVHSITDDDVSDAKTFRSYARALAAYLDGCDLAGFGVERFDLPLLEAEFARADVEFTVQGRAVVDAMAVFHRLDPRDLRAAYRRFTGGELPDAREADTGARAALEVLEGQLAKHPELPQDPSGLGAWSTAKPEWAIDREARLVWRNGRALMNFGKYVALSLEHVLENDPGYLAWLCDESEFEPELKQIVRDALAGRLPVQ